MRYLLWIALICLGSWASAEQPVRLSSANYEALAPRGKEVDAIYGDYVLRNDWLVAVVGKPGKRRDANMTVRDVGGALIDLTLRDRQNDQLSCLYPGGAAFTLTKQIDWPVEWGRATGATLAFKGRSESPNQDLEIEVGYELRDADPFLRLVTTVTNRGVESVEFQPLDGLRADGKTFEYDVDASLQLFGAFDPAWRQAYGVLPQQNQQIDQQKPRDYKSPRTITYGEKAVELGLNDSYTWKRKVFVSQSNLGLLEIAHKLRGEEVFPATVHVTDGKLPIEGAAVRVMKISQNDDPEQRISQGVGHTDAKGEFSCKLPAGEYLLRVRHQAHGASEARLALIAKVKPAGRSTRASIALPKCGYAEANISGIQRNPPGSESQVSLQPIAAKVEFLGVGETPSPDFGPDSAVFGVKNLRYTPNGKFRCKLLPGEYRYIASHGPEYHAYFGKIAVQAGQTSLISVPLGRAFDTTGWLSSELHSHSTPSGDNTGSQAGRVLNLLAEHLEFCPCTEHQRIDVYDEHLHRFGARSRMLTCPGMELTGEPLPLNHQNAFPLRHKPRTQDGGGPRTQPDPIAQIERLAGWDEGSEKLMQMNHPDIAQMVGDRDQDGVADQGFERMFGFMDVIEVHPPELIFETPDPEVEKSRGYGKTGWQNSMVRWMQLLNLGYRVPGVVNTDAHYNWHGSGWLRNWVRSSTDNPAEASVAELVREFELGHVIMSNGPFLEVTADAQGAKAIPGDDLSAPDGVLHVQVAVRCPNWIEVNRVQLFLNGRPVPEHNYTARSHPEWFGKEADTFNRKLLVELPADTHLIVACCGEGKSIGPMYGGEDWGRNMPVAVANPIFVDVDGDAFEPNEDDLGLPLPVPADLKPSHGHDHPNHAR